MTDKFNAIFSKDNLPAAGLVLLLAVWFPLMWLFGVTAPPWAPKPLPAVVPSVAAPALSPSASSSMPTAPVPGFPALPAVSSSTPVPMERGETVTVGSAEFKAEIDWRNGAVSSVALLKHTQADRRTPIMLGGMEKPLGWLHTARFLTTAPQLHFLPALDVPEIAFVGRSNAGKSTLLKVLKGLQPIDGGNIMYPK